jgi:hypothetical protein
VPSQPQQLPANSIPSPYIHRANGLLQIAVSTPLRIRSIGAREVLAAERELRLQSAQEGTQIAASQHADLDRNLLFSLRSQFVATMQAKAVLALTKKELDYYDHLIDISRLRFQKGDIAQIDFDRIELQRVQYESDLETAIVNLRQAKIILLQLLDDKTPVEQFDVKGGFDFGDQLQSVEAFRQIAMDMGVPIKRVSILSAASALEAKQDASLSIQRGVSTCSRRPLMFAVFIQYPRDHRWCSTRNEPKSSDYPFRTDRASE